MAEYSINKGIGRNAEFRGLKSRYLFIFAGGLLSVFVVFVVMYLVGVPQWLCIALGVAGALALVAGVFRMNAKYGEHGLMKLQASRNRPRFIINRRKIPALFTRNLKSVR